MISNLINSCRNGNEISQAYDFLIKHAVKDPFVLHELRLEPGSSRVSSNGPPRGDTTRSDVTEIYIGHITAAGGHFVTLCPTNDELLAVKKDGDSWSGVVEFENVRVRHFTLNTTVITAAPLHTHQTNLQMKLWDGGMYPWANSASSECSPVDSAAEKFCRELGVTIDNRTPTQNCCSFTSILCGLIIAGKVGACGALASAPSSDSPARPSTASKHDAQGALGVLSACYM